jgi:xanthine dehydrogenase accessory factor
VLQQRKSTLVRYALMEGGGASTDERLDAACGGRATVFFDYIGYAGHVFILGGGHVGQAIARHLQPLGLHVTVVDHRPEVAEGFQGANRVIVGNYAAALADESVPEGSYFLITTPSHAFDYESLRDIMASNWKPRYVGMLGSRPKAESMTARLVEELGAERINWSVLYCPVGLDIGGPSPDEIAISIISEIQALRYGKKGHKHMRLAWPQQ